MKLHGYLDEMGVPYRVGRHRPAFTAQELAAAEHVPGGKVIKPVIVRADGRYVLCALPASHRVDLDELRRQLGADELHLCDEGAVAGLFPDCEPGAVPPVGALYGLPTVMDGSLLHDDHVTFQAGTHHESVTMTLAAWRRAASPEVAHFGRHV